MALCRQPFCRHGGKKGLRRNCNQCLMMLALNDNRYGAFLPGRGSRQANSGQAGRVKSAKIVFGIIVAVTINPVMASRTQQHKILAVIRPCQCLFYAVCGISPGAFRAGRKNMGHFSPFHRRTDTKIMCQIGSAEFTMTRSTDPDQSSHFRASVKTPTRIIRLFFRIHVRILLKRKSH